MFIRIPTQAFIHLGHLLAGFENAPIQEALIQGFGLTADQVTHPLTNCTGVSSAMKRFVRKKPKRSSINPRRPKPQLLKIGMAMERWITQ